MPVLPGSGLLTSAEEAGQLADGIGYPVLLKATGGGGGIGIYICTSHDEVVNQFAVAARQGQANFGDSGKRIAPYFLLKRWTTFDTIDFLWCQTSRCMLGLCQPACPAGT